MWSTSSKIIHDMVILLRFLFFIHQATAPGSGGLHGSTRLHPVASVGRISPKSAKLMAFSPARLAEGAEPERNGFPGFLSEATWWRTTHES